MPREIPVQCPPCQLRFEVDLDDYEVIRVFYRDGRTRVEEYRILCPRCSAYSIVPVTIEEVSDGEDNASVET